MRAFPEEFPMFFTYLRRELRRRIRQATFIALGLALGIGLVITVTAASSGVKNAQATVLHSLYGVGTDVTVTQAPTAGSGGPTGFGFRGRGGNQARPAAGTKIDIDNLTSIGQGTLAASSVTSIGKLTHVAGAAGALSLTDAVITGKIPAINTSGGGFGGGGGGSFRGNFKSSSFTVSGVDLNTGALGPLSSAKLKSGRTFASSDAAANVAVVNADYATQKKLGVGSTVTVAKTSFKVVGVASAGSDASDVFIPLARAQALAGLKGKVNTIYVAADSASNISGVAGEISGMLPKATVTTSSSLASEVTGSLSSAASLANNLGKWLAIAVLIAAFLLASLLTSGAVARRVREFGTLKALGWRSRRIVGQVMGESGAIGVVGGVVGVALGFAGAALVEKLARPLTASVGQTTGSATPGGAPALRGGGGVRVGGRPAAPGRGPVQSRVPASAAVAAAATARKRAAGAVVATATNRAERGIMYKLTGGAKKYQKGRTTVDALAGVDLVIEDGEWLAIQGPTGHGKTTLLQVLGGLDRPTSGVVEFDGQDLAALRETQVTKVRATSMGFIFQTFNLIPTLNALENVEVALVPLGVGAAERRARATVALENMGLGERLQHLPGEMSGGQQQRVAIARALVKEPKVLLADEPTGNLDEGTRDDIMGLLEQLWRDTGLTLVLVTHDSSVARRAQRIGIMQHGKLSIRQDTRGATA